ncbi:MAG: hypothetical protein HOO67_07530 [Candidatus Peribacteraceae bacterium]|nr:hypothetical protein [Candidatus Peribacteraceae bacterium]
MKAKLLLTGLLFVMLHAERASAHATPVLYTPASSSVVAEMPEAVTIRFSERIETFASSITVFAPDGKKVNEGPGTVDRSNTHIFSVPVNATGSGTYTVSWQVISADDGHFTKGAFIFSIGKQDGSGLSARGQFQIQHRSSWPEAIGIFLELLGEAMLVGALVLMAYLWRSLRKDGMPATADGLLSRRLRMMMTAAFVLILTGGILSLALATSNLATDQGSPWSPAFRAILSTISGRFTLCRIALGACACTLFFADTRRITAARRFTMNEILLWVIVIVIALMRARVSHAAASSFYPVFSVAMNAVHLLFKDLWIGGLIVLVGAFLPIFHRQKDPRLAALTLIRFSQIAMVSLAVGGLSGIYIVWLHLKSTVNLFTTHWGGGLIALGGFAALLIVLRLYHQMDVLGALIGKRDGPNRNNQKETLSTAGGAFVFETLAGIAALLFSSILIITTPPLSTQNFYAQAVTTDHATVTFGEHRSDDGQFLITVARGGRQTSATGAVTVTLRNKEKSIGPIVAETRLRFPGGYVFPQQTLSAPGTWTIGVTEHEEGAFDAVAEFTLRVPTDIDAVHRFDETRGFGAFETGMIVTALALLALAYFLVRRLRTLEEYGEKTTWKGATDIISFWKPWLVAPGGIIALILIGAFLGNHNNHGNGTFIRACRLAGGTWHESVPMRGGRVTAEMPVLGCMIGMGGGQFHFADHREFAWFTRRTSAYATMTTSPEFIEAGKPVTLMFSLKDDEGKPLQDLTFEHDRILHAVIVSHDLKTFAHAHVEDATPVSAEMLTNATLPVRHTFPRPGRYLVGIDYTVRAQTFAQQFTVDVRGNDEMSAPEPDSSLEKTVDGMTVRLIAPATVKSGIVQKLRYVFEEDGEAVHDLEPYLAAPMHLSIVKTDLQKLIHTHAELPQTWWGSIFNRRDPNAKHVHMFLPDRFGPEFVVYAYFPTPGEYELLGEINRGGKIVLTRFTMTVQ